MRYLTVANLEEHVDKMIRWSQLMSTCVRGDASCIHDESKATFITLLRPSSVLSISTLFSNIMIFCTGCAACCFLLCSVVFD